MAIGYRLGEWTVRPHRNRIERGNESVHLAPKAMAVLDCLARATNSVVTRHEIFDAVWPGMAVSDEVLTQRIAEIRKAFGDSAQQPKIIETIPKIGFRLIPPVIPLSEESASTQEFHQATGSRPVLKWYVTAMVCLLVIAVSVSRFWPVRLVNQEPSADGGAPIIAVLPFVNMSDDPGNEYFSDGISEELINLLAQVPGLHVISRSSSFSFKGERMKMADIADELNASLIVEGTVRKMDNRVRITAQLIDPNTDEHLWSEAYDHQLSDIFSTQEIIAQSIVTALQGEIGAQKVSSSRPTKSIEAYELFLQGRHFFYQRGPALDSAIMLLQMAVDEDPEFAEAWAYLAAVACVTWAYQTAISDEDAWQLAEQAARASLGLDPGMGLALAAQAMIAYGHEGNLQKGFRLIDLAAKEYPADTTVRLWAGMYNHHWGYLKKAHSHFLYAFKHNPRAGITNGMLAQIYLEQGLEELAAPHLAKATELGWPLHIYTLASLHMMRSEIDVGFAFLKASFADLRAESVPLPWIYELEKVGRTYVDNPTSTDALISLIESVPRTGIWGKPYLFLIFGLKDQFFEHFSRSVKEDHLWTMFMMTIWLPENRAYVEDPRFFEIMSDDGAVEVWEQRGYPDGCLRFKQPTGDHLNCSERYQ